MREKKVQSHTSEYRDSYTEVESVRYGRKRIKQNRRRRISTILAAIVVFFTTYSLILPAITMTKEDQVLNCAIDVHKHTSSCYRDVIQDGRVVGKELACGLADYVVHEHNADCYSEVKADDGSVEKRLVCELPEIKEHKHTKDCYKEEKILTCDKVENDGHQHDSSCYDVENVLSCEKAEHVHNDSCYSDVVVDTEKHRICGYDDGEEISPAILDDEGNVVEEAVVHHHDDGCYEIVEITEKQLTCGQEEHTHDASCYEEVKTLSCGIDEGEGAHHHNDKCYEIVQTLTCDKLELHRHTDQCYAKGHKGDAAYLICGKLELLQHTHGKGCFVTVETVEATEIETVEETETETAEATEFASESESSTETDEVIEVVTEKDAENTTVAESEKETEEYTEAITEATIVKDTTKEETIEDATEAGIEETAEDVAAFASGDVTLSVVNAPYKVHVSYDESAGIPAAAEFIITQPGADAEAYTTRALDMVNDHFDDVTGQIDLVGLFDLTMKANGQAISPTGKVSVELVFNDEIKGNQQIFAVHFPGTGEQPMADEAPDNKRDDTSSTQGGPRKSRKQTATVATSNEPELIALDVNGRKASFEADSFSYYAIVSYTVDFYYGDYEWHIDGGGEIRLSELFSVLGIEKNAADAVSVDFTNYELIEVSKVLDDESGERVDWLLTSLQAFDTEETLTVRMADGSVIEIRVEDLQQVTYSINFSPANSGTLSKAPSGYLTKTNGYNNNGFTVKANSGYVFDHWDVNGSSATIDSSKITVSGDKSTCTVAGGGIYIGEKNNSVVTAVFKSTAPPSYSFTYSTQGSGTVNKTSGTSTDQTGATATASDGYHFAGWSINGEIVSANPIFDPSFVTANNTVVTAVFRAGDAPAVSQFTYKVNDEQGGTVQLVNSSGNASGSNNSGTTVTDSLNGSETASARFAVPVPAPGYRFVNWTNGGQIYTKRDGSTANTIRPKLTEYADGLYSTGTFVANFVPENDYLITLVAGEGGYTTIGGDRDRTTIRLSEMMSDPGIYAWPDAGYHTLGWVDETGTIIGGLHAGDARLYSDAVPQNRDSVLTAIFERITDINIYYRTSSTYGTVTSEHELVHLAEDIYDTEVEGSTAVPKDGYKFISWVNQDGETVWPVEEFEPFGEDMLYEGATYTAVFESDAYERYLLISPDEKDHGYVISPQYPNSVNGRIVTMYIRDNKTIPADLTAVAYEDWVFDHWEVQSQTILDPETGEAIGATIPADFDFSSYDLRDSWNVLMAYFRPDDDPVTHRIIYTTTTGGTVTGLAGNEDGSGNYYDEWIGSKADGIVKGATATASDGYEFKGWAEEILDADGNGTGQYMFPCYSSTFVPSGKDLKDTTYIATFIPSKNMVGYNMNVADVPVKWDGVKELVVAAGNVSETTTNYSPMYYDTKNGTYWEFGDVFSLDTHIPEAEGYYFVGWYNKNRPAVRWNGSSWENYYDSNGKQVEVPGTIISRGKRVDRDGHDMNNIIFPYASAKNRYTFEAMYIGIKGISKRLPYDGDYHQLTAEAYFEAGSVAGNDRYKQQLDAIKNAGGYEMGTVYYQLIDDDGNPIGEPTTEFKRLDPGFYRVRAYADCRWDTETFRVHKDITLEIYPAKLIIKKYWINDTSMGLRPDDLEVKKNRYNQKTQGVVDVTNSTQLSSAMERAAEKNISADDLYGPRNATAESPKTDPKWTKEGDVWTKEYDDILVRPNGYDEIDQVSGYYLHFAEETVPEEYELVNQTWERSSDMLTTTITFTNQPKTLRVVLKKTDEDGNDLTGATFRLTKVKNYDGTLLSPAYVVDPKFPLGEKSVPLTSGYYMLEETKAANGYSLLSEPVRFRVKAMEETIEVTNDSWMVVPLPEEGVVSIEANTLKVKNYKPASIAIKKVDKADENTKVQGAIFQLLCGSEAVDPTKMVTTPAINRFKDVTGIGTVTDPNDNNTTWKGAFQTDGTIHEIKNLPDGNYTLKEVKMPTGYGKTFGNITFTVTKGVVKNLQVENNDGSVILSKEDGNTYTEEETSGTVALFTVKNIASVSLPETGGSGTRRLYLIGSVIALFGGALLVMKKRKAA